MTGDGDAHTILVRVSGPDHPGITAGLMATLDGLGARVLDIEQIVIRSRLTLGLVVEVPEGRDLLRDLLLFGRDHGVDVDVEVLDDADAASGAEPGHVVTLVGPSLTPAELGAATTAVAGVGANIERIVRLSRYPVMSYELLVRGGDPTKLRAELLGAASRHDGLDVAVQAEGLGRRAKRLVVLDVDSTLVQDEVIELLAAEAGSLEAVRRLTTGAMAGEIDFETSLRERVRLLAGLDASALERARRRLRLTPGARTFVRTLRRLGYTTAIVSGGFTVFTDELRARLGIDHAHANRLGISDGRVTGELVGEVVDRAAKARYLVELAHRIGVPLGQTVAVGDGANDIDMLDVAGLGIAFNAKPVVRRAADTSLRVPYLDAVLFLLGIRREDVEAADRADPPPVEPPDSARARGAR